MRRVLSSGGSRWRWWCSRFLGDVFVVGVGNDAQGSVPECELGVAEERFIGGGDETSGHLEDGVGASSLDAGSEFLGLRFEFGWQRLGHDDLRPE